MLVIRSLADLKQAPRHKRVNGFLERQPVMLDLPDIALAKQLRWQRRFDALQRRCGCAIAAAALLVTFVLCLVQLYQALARLSMLEIIGYGLVSVGIALLVAFLAKAVTLFVTQLEFKWVCHRLRDDFK